MPKHRDDEMRMRRELMETAKDMSDCGAISESDLTRVRGLCELSRAESRTRKARSPVLKRERRTSEPK